MWWCIRSSLRSKKGKNKIMVAMDISLYYVPQEGSVASSFFSLKYPVHDPGVWWFSSPGWGCGEGAGCGSGGGLGLR